MRYETWVERQIREAQERGEFDHLPGEGKPIPGLGGREDPDWWVKSMMEREGLRMPLPPLLALRREIEQLPKALDALTDEAAVRETVADLNRRIVRARQTVLDGPRVLVPSVDVERALTGWRERRSA